MRAWYRYDFLPWYRRQREKILMFIAWHLVPKPVRYWVTVRACVDATPEDKGPSEITIPEILKAFGSV